MAFADGITHIVATPHANDRYHYDREYLVAMLVRLRELVGSAPKLSLGCDFHLSYDNLQAVLAHPARYSIQGSNYLLVELSNYSVPPQISDCFQKLGAKGITPILTHPERNPILQRTPQRVLEWVEQGCAVQVTASALTGNWGEKGLSVAKWLLGALLALTAQFVTVSTASASCGDYLLHGQSTHGFPDGHNVAESDSIRAMPRSQVPCKGVNCSRGKPLAPPPGLPPN